jgi:integrase
MAKSKQEAKQQEPEEKKTISFRFSDTKYYPALERVSRKDKRKRSEAKFRNYMAAQCQEHGFPKLTIHDMRRTFASLIASSRSLSMYELARWLGDDLNVVERHYGHLQPHDGAINLAFA